MYNIILYHFKTYCVWLTLPLWVLSDSVVMKTREAFEEPLRLPTGSSYAGHQSTVTVDAMYVAR